MSKLFFKFKSSKDFDNLDCDGQMSAYDVKVAITTKYKLDKDPNFDLQLVNAQTQEEVAESQMVPAGTSLIVKRVPVKQMRRKFEAPTSRNVGADSLSSSSNFVGAASSALPLLAGGGENDRLDALLSQGAGWQPGQAVPVRPRFLQSASQKLPPPTYVCHRCQQTGHWINMCPTNGDTKYDFKRIKKATGIPRAFLESVEEAEVTDGSVALPGGGFAKVRTNDNNFSDLALAADADFESDPNLDPSFRCGLCSNVIVSAVSTPCCSANYCDKCVRKRLVTSNFACPGCKQQISPDSLVPNKELRSDIDSARRKRITEIMNSKREQKVDEVVESAAAAPPAPAEDRPPGKDRFIGNERVCRDWDAQRPCKFGPNCAFLHPNKDGIDPRGNAEERRELLKRIAPLSLPRERQDRERSPDRRRSRSRSPPRTSRRRSRSNSPPVRSRRSPSPKSRRSPSPKSKRRSRSRSPPRRKRSRSRSRSRSGERRRR